MSEGGDNNKSHHMFKLNFKISQKHLYNFYILKKNLPNQSNWDYKNIISCIVINVSRCLVIKYIFWKKKHHSFTPINS